MKTCKSCGKLNEVQTSLTSSRQPREGDVSICLYCGTICWFDKDLNLVPLTKDELEIWDKSDSEGFRIVKRAQRIIQQKIQMN